MTFSKQDRRRFAVVFAIYSLGVLALLLALAISTVRTAVETSQSTAPLAAGRQLRTIHLPTLSAPLPHAEAIAMRSANPPGVRAGNRQNNEAEAADVKVPNQSYRIELDLNHETFSFRNYGPHFPAGDLGINQVRQLFGNQVCASLKDEICVPLPQTQFWIDQMNGAMDGGHCVGFTILSHRFKTGQFRPINFSVAAQNVWEMPQNVQLMRQIAQDWVLQVANEVQNVTVRGTPRQIVDALLTLQQPVDLGIFARNGGGHSMLAYGVENQGNGRFHIQVYDNNWPGRKLFVEVDFRSNTWRYSMAAQSLNDDPSLWEGDASTQSLIYIPFSAYDQPIACPFCLPTYANTTSIRSSGIDPSAARFNILSLSGVTGRQQVVDTAGRRLGHFGELFVNEIPGAQLIRLRSAHFNNSEPYLAIPTQMSFTVQIAARPGETASQGNLRIVGPSMSVAMDGLRVPAGESDQLTVEPGQQRIDYRASGRRQPILKFAYTGNSTPNSPDHLPAEDEVASRSAEVDLDPQTYFFTVANAEFAAGQGLDSALDPTTLDFALAGKALPSQRLKVTIVKIKGQTMSLFFNDNVELPASGSLQFKLAEWDGGPLSMVTTTAEGQRTTTWIEPQPLVNLLVDGTTAEALVIQLADLIPYLDQAQIEQMLERLGELGFTGTELGQILAAFDEVTLDAEQLAALIDASALTASEVARLLAQLPLDPSAAQALSEQVTSESGMNGVEVAVLRSELQRQAATRARLAEWSFRNQGLDQLAAFLNEQALDEYDLAAFLSAADVPLDQLEGVVEGLALDDGQMRTLLAGLDPAMITAIPEIVQKSKSESQLAVQHQRNSQRTANESGSLVALIAATTTTAATATQPPVRKPTQAAPTATTSAPTRPTSTPRPTLTPVPTEPARPTPLLPATETPSPTTLPAPTEVPIPSQTPTPTVTQPDPPTSTSTPTPLIELPTPREEVPTRATATPEITATVTATRTETATITPVTATATESIATNTLTPVETVTPLETTTPTHILLPTETATAPVTSTPIPSETPTPATPPTVYETPTPTRTKNTDNNPTKTKTPTPSDTPTPVASPTVDETPTPTRTKNTGNNPTKTQTPIPSDTPTFVASPTATETPIPPTITPTEKASATETPTTTHEPTATDTERHTPTPSQLETALPTDTPIPVATESATPEATPTIPDVSVP